MAFIGDGVSGTRAAVGQREVKMRSHSRSQSMTEAPASRSLEPTSQVSNAAAQAGLNQSANESVELGFLDGLEWDDEGESLLDSALAEAFGEDVSGVKARDASAHEAEALNARAFCEDSEVAFGPDVDPTNLSDEASMRTVAHEYAHALAPTGAETEIDQPGDRGELLADRAGDAFGAWMGSGMRGEAPSLAPALGGQARIQRETQDESAMENEFRENVLAGECAALSSEQEDLMDVFVAEAGAMFDVWTTVRGQSAPEFDGAPLENRLLQFYADWVRLPNNLDMEGNPVVFDAVPGAHEELVRRLNAGLVPTYLREIRMFNWPALASYVRLMGVEDQEVSHQYELIMTASLSGGGGEVLVAEGELVAHQIRYSNSLGMAWTQNTNCGKLGGGVGVSTIPVSVNVASGLGGGAFNAGSASSRRYFAPDFFDAAMVSYVGGEALVGAGGSVGAVVFTNGSESIEFDTSGAIGKFGTDDAGAASATMGLGLCASSYTSPGAVLPAPTVTTEQARQGQWTPLIEAGVFFATGEAALDSGDIGTVQQVAGAIRSHDAVSPGDAFRVALVGRASNRWRGKTGESTPEELNAGLAGDRARAVEGALMVELGDIEAEVTEGVFSESKMLSLAGQAHGTDPDDNGQIDRSVQVAVLYNPCATEGQVTP